MKRRQIQWLLLALLFLLPGMAQALGKGAEVKKIPKEELASMMGKPDVIIIDVRSEGDWKGAKEKIKGAIRENPEDIKTWAPKYPKEKTLVFYCA